MGHSLWKLLRGEDLQTTQEAAATPEVEEEAKIELAKVVKTDNPAASVLEPETFTGPVDLEVALISPPSR